MKRIVTGGALAIAAVALAGVVYAADHPLATLKLILKQNTATLKEKGVWVVKPLSAPPPAASPIDVGATLEVKGINQTASAVLSAGAANWKTNTSGTLFKYINKLAPGGTRVQGGRPKDTKVLKVVCKDSLINLDDATQGTVTAKLTIGSDVYCSKCTAPLKDELGKYIAKGCTAPADCGAYGSASLAFLGSSADLLD
jgi:hypothetical protein